MEYKEEDINEAATSKKRKVLEQRNQEERQAKFWSKVLIHVLKQILIRGVVVYLFYNAFLILVQGLKGSMQENVNYGKCPQEEK